MALTRTTLSSAVGVQDNTISVAAATGAAAGTLVLIDQEVMKIAQTYVSGTILPIVRGQDGSAQVVHSASAGVVFFLASDEAGPLNQAHVQWPAGAHPRNVVSYSASGAIALPTPGSDMVAMLNGTSGLTMTLAVPTVDMDGCILIVCANGKAAHTVTASGGFGANTTASDVMTFHATQVTSFACIAAAGVWNLIGFVAGAATVAGPGLA